MKAGDEDWVWLKEGRWTEKHLDWLMPELRQKRGRRESEWVGMDRQRTTARRRDCPGEEGVVRWSKGEEEVCDGYPTAGRGSGEEEGLGWGRERRGWDPAKGRGDLESGSCSM